jgi:hypothetical protein
VPGSATIGTNLVDSLLGTVDDLRGSLNTDMGTRQWRVYVVRRVWSGERRGEGTSSDTLTELTPQPLVGPNDLFYTSSAAGLEEDGNVTLSEVSLTYTEDELNPSAAANEDVFYLLRDAHGQSIADRYFTVSEPPKPDRVNTIGWIVRLKQATVDGCG